MATNGLNRRDLQLWIDDETHFDSESLNASKSKSASNSNPHQSEKVHSAECADSDGNTDRLWAIGVYRCTDCTLMDGIVCCSKHPDSPLVSYSKTSSNIGLQSCVEELFCCGEPDCGYHVHSDHNFHGHSCSFCGNRCTIQFVVLSLK